MQGCLRIQIGANGALLGPSFFLPTNRNAFVTDYIGSSGWSNYHGLQAEIRKRFNDGWYYQVNYTWSKAFTNAEQAQAEFSPYLDNTIGDTLEKEATQPGRSSRAEGNAVYELPFGPGKRFFIEADSQARCLVVGRSAVLRRSEPAGRLRLSPDAEL